MPQSPAKKSRVELIKSKRKSPLPTPPKRKIEGALSKEELINLFSLMVKSRVLEERLIKIYKSGEAFFWIAWGERWRSFKLICKMSSSKDVYETFVPFEKHIKI